MAPQAVWNVPEPLSVQSGRGRETQPGREPDTVIADDLAGEWWRPFTQVDDVAVVHVDLAPDPSRESEARARLDGDEQRRWQRFRHERARYRYALCRASLRSVLCDALDCPNERLGFGSAAHGKPFATVGGRRAPISFNVSHSGDHGLIAVTRSGRVGIDVEPRLPRHNLDTLIAAVLSPDEQDELATERGPRKLHIFFMLWTIKEALSKAHGKGLSMDVSSFEVPRPMRSGERRGLFQFPHSPETTWQVDNIGTDSFAAAVAHELHPKGD